MVQSCSAQTKSPQCPPVRNLMPLPIPNMPWSHIAADFVTDLPESKGYTTELAVVDRLSKGCKFVPFRSLPSTLQVAEDLFQFLFCCYQLPEDILSDHGPNSYQNSGRHSSRGRVVMISLTSGNHPESNGQAERTIQELRRFLWAYCHSCQCDWGEYLLWA